MHPTQHKAISQPTSKVSHSRTPTCQKYLHVGALVFETGFPRSKTLRIEVYFLTCVQSPERPHHGPDGSYRSPAFNPHWTQSHTATGSEPNKCPLSTQLVDCRYSRSGSNRVTGVRVRDPGADSKGARRQNDGGHCDVYIACRQALVVHPAPAAIEIPG